MEKKPYKVIKSKNATIKNKSIVQKKKLKSSGCCGSKKLKKKS